MKLGVIFVPVNILYREREMNHILDDAEPKALAAGACDTTAVPLWPRAELAAQAVEMPADLEPLPLDGDTPAALAHLQIFDREAPACAGSPQKRDVARPMLSERKRRACHQRQRDADPADEVEKRIGREGSQLGGISGIELRWSLRY